MNEIPELTKKELKQFGCILGILIAVVFGVVIPWLWSALTFPNVYIIGIGLGVTIFSLVFPSQVIYLYKPYMRLALFIGKIINSIILGIIYYLLIFPYPSMTSCYEVFFQCFLLNAQIPLFSIY